MKIEYLENGLVKIIGEYGSCVFNTQEPYSLKWRKQKQNRALCSKRPTFLNTSTIFLVMLENYTKKVNTTPERQLLMIRMIIFQMKVKVILKNWQQNVLTR